MNMVAAVRQTSVNRIKKKAMRMTGRQAAIYRMHRRNAAPEAATAICSGSVAIA